MYRNDDDDDDDNDHNHDDEDDANDDDNITPVYNKTILGPKRLPGETFFFGHFLLRLDRFDHS